MLVDGVPRLRVVVRVAGPEGAILELASMGENLRPRGQR